ncbi:hypothetical protein JCM9533A_19380 [Catenuloplanes niger JCM 9533]|uniref:Uncharacterized protein n=1 Tax=Catenuloplanes niger TaxID=587534 RepID=A0AAE3ZND1_9ACTN|nr:hypothetical protein [Catenuloplanes niger]
MRVSGHVDVQPYRRVRGPVVHRDPAAGDAGPRIPARPRAGGQARYAWMSARYAAGAFGPIGLVLSADRM